MNNDLIGIITDNTEITPDIETDTIEGELNAIVIDYALAANKPSINNVTLSGNKSLTELGIEIPTKVSDLQNDSGYITSYTETDPVFSASVASTITTEDITKWNNQSSGTSDYDDLENKPIINNVTLSGNKSLGDLGIQPSGNYLTSETDPIFTASASYGITSTDINNWNGKSNFSGSYNDLTDKPTIPNEVTETTVSNWGFTKNTGTITSIKMNGSTISSSGEADLGTVITQHQDISGKLDSNKVKTSTSTTSGDVYDVTYINSTLGDIESLLGGI